MLRVWYRLKDMGVAIMLMNFPEIQQCDEFYILEIDAKLLKLQ